MDAIIERLRESEAELVAVLKPFFRPFEMKRPFSAHQIDVLRWVLGSVVVLMSAWAAAGFCGSSENS